MSALQNSSQRRVIASSTPLRRAPGDEAPLDSQLLFGEIFSVHSEAYGWAQGQAALDHYKGYTPVSALGPIGPLPTHTIRVPRTFVYRDADIKSPPLMWLNMNSNIAVTAQMDGFSRIEELGWVYTAHIIPVGAHAEDFVRVAEEFLGAPYLWGGKDSLGMDCSGLLQTAMQRAGLICPRDSHQQAELGEAAPTGLTDLRRGDLIFWKGHVGIMRDPEMLLHANAHHMRVVSEPLTAAVARIAASGLEVTGVRRLPRTGS